MKKNNYKFYHFARVIVKLVGNLYFGGKIIGKENIPTNGSCILAGNHESNFDSYLLLASTKRPIHFLGKKELFESPFSFIFKLMHLIPVDRKAKNPEARRVAIELLQNGAVIGIFPEGTFRNKTDLILPFKPGVVDFALKTNSLIVPFAIIGQFKFRSHPTIVFGTPLDITKVEEPDKVKYFEQVIKDMLIQNKK